MTEPMPIGDLVDQLYRSDPEIRARCDAFAAVMTRAGADGCGSWPKAVKLLRLLAATGDAEAGELLADLEAEGATRPH